MNPSVNLQKYEHGECLGSGGQGSVYKAVRKLDRRTFAMKIITALTEELHKKNVKEVEHMLKLSHRNLVPCHDFFETTKLVSEDPPDKVWRVHIVMPLYENGDLYSHIKKKGPLSRERAERLLKEMGGVLQYTHSKGFIHRDVKPQNIMVSTPLSAAGVGGEAEFILADLGLSKEAASGGASTLVGTPAFMAPEVLGSRYTNKVDMWALGVTMCYVVLQEDLRDLFLGYLQTNRELVIGKLQTHLPSALGAPLCEVVLRLLSTDPSERPSAEELRSEPGQEPESSSQGPHLDECAKTIQRAVKRFLNRLAYWKILRPWKEEEKERMQRLASGKPGFIGFGIGSKMAINVLSKHVRENGFELGDVIVLVQRKGRGGVQVNCPTPTKEALLEAVSPQSEVFEGTVIFITVVRNPEEQKMWRWMSKKHSSVSLDSWMRAIADVETVTLPVTLREVSAEELHDALKRCSRTAGAIDSTLIVDVLCNPIKFKAYTKQVFKTVYEETAVTHGSFNKALEYDEIELVCDRVARQMGRPPPSGEELRKMFYNMDERWDGEVDFEGFFPHFRLFQMKAIAKMLHRSQEPERRRTYN